MKQSRIEILRGALDPMGLRRLVGPVKQAFERTVGNARLGTVMILTAFAVFAQGPDVRPSYEVATIKPNPTGSGNRGLKEDKAEAVFTSVPLKRLIELA